MSKRGVSVTVSFKAWDTGTNAPKTGDAANITAYISKDGGAYVAATNAPTEIMFPSSVASGRYTITLTAAEMVANSVRVSAKSTTSSVQCEDVFFVTESQYGVNACTVTAKTDADVPIPSALVKILNSDKTADIAVGLTDSNGVYAINIDPGTYYVRTYKTGYTFDSAEYTLVVAADGDTVAAVGTAVPVVSPDVPTASVQVVTLYPQDPSLVLDSTCQITAEAIGPNQYVDGVVLTAKKKQFAVVGGSYFACDLQKGGRFRISGYSGTKKFLSGEITITDDNTRPLSEYTEITWL